jgi:tetratricopeptide (TPR) repeat protein
MESAYANENAKVRAIRGLAVSYEKTEQLDLAIELYQALVEKVPDRPVYYYRLGELMNDVGRHKEAISRVKEGKQLDTECGAHGYCVLGQAYEKLGQYDRAKREFKKALNCNDKNFNDYATKQIDRQEQLKKIEELKKEKEKYGY